jgi:hypothetical protein
VNNFDLGYRDSLWARLEEKDAQIERLKALCARALAALEADQMSYGDYDNLVAELRTAAQ